MGNPESVELRELRDQQAATSEILRAISSMPSDLELICQLIIDKAALLTDTVVAALSLHEGGSVFRGIAGIGWPSEVVRQSLTQRFSVGRSLFREHGPWRPLHITDLKESEAYRQGEPLAVICCDKIGINTFLAVPLIAQDRLAGAFFVARKEIRPFTDKQIELLETFADQAVVAIENARVLKALDERNKELTESLARQTATSEILRAISSSPNDLAPIFQLILEKSAQLADSGGICLWLRENNLIRCVATFKLDADWAAELMREPKAFPSFRKEEGSWHPFQVLDFRETKLYRGKDPFAVRLCDIEGYRTIMFIPLVAKEQVIGAISVARQEIRAFTDAQLDLLKTFADQAVVAIENARVLKALDERNKELTESLARQTATSEILRAISRMPTDLEPICQMILEKAAFLAEANIGGIALYLGGHEFLAIAGLGLSQEMTNQARARRYSLTRYEFREHGPWRALHIPDVKESEAYRQGHLRVIDSWGIRTCLAVPLVAENRFVGTLVVGRNEVRPFTEKQIAILQTFADQAVIAIENARMFREIQTKNKELEVASQHKSEFLANMSHELRTPLNAILGFSEALNDGIFGELNPRQADYLRDIHSSGQHLLSLINDILDLAKVEAGRMELLVEAFDAPSAIESALTLVKERATRHGIRLTLEIDDQLGEFSGDERKFKQVLLNLLSNAVKFTPEGGSVTLNAQATNDGLQVSVRDTGIGIAEEYQVKVFEAFQQAGGSHNVKREGTGLGLTLARQFVEMHGGKMWLESKPGAGSTFTFNMVAQLCPTN